MSNIYLKNLYNLYKHVGSNIPYYIGVHFKYLYWDAHRALFVLDIHRGSN